VQEIEILKLIITFGTTLLAMFLGYFIAVRKFKKEKIWQEKYKSYQDILSALEAMLLWANEIYCYNKMIPTKGTKNCDNSKHLSYSESRRIIAKTACIGKLLICNEVIQELEQLEQEIWKEDFRADDERNYYPNTPEESEAIALHARNIENIITPRLEKIIFYAKKDLE
jgi:hypothetical protein